MKAVILASGKGKRMMPLTENTPKPMVKIHGKPILEYRLNVLPENISEIIMVTGHLEEQIHNYFGNKFNSKKITYLHQKDLGGTWQALKLAKNNLDNGESFLLLNSDDLQDKKSLQEIIKHKNALLVSTHDNPQKFGVVEVDDSGNILKVVEKPEHPKTNLVSTGVYVLQNNIFNYADPEPINGEYYLPSVFNNYLIDNKIKAVVTDNWTPLGTPEDVARAHDIIRG
jgi:NDP-sugar pyrophosphorylase family protein